jgi:hypothetical protein
MAQEVEHLPGKMEVMDLTPSTAKIKDNQPLKDSTCVLGNAGLFSGKTKTFD